MTIQLTSEQLETVRAALQAQHGVALTGTVGAVESEGVKLSYEYDGQMLTIEVLHHPRTKPTWAIEDAVKGWIRSSLV